KSFSVVLVLLLTCFVFSEAPAQFRNTVQVEQQIVGTWKVVNMVVNPGEPFYGTKEEKAFVDEVWQETVKAFMGSTVFTFYSNKKYFVRVLKEDGKYKHHKGKW